MDPYRLYYSPLVAGCTAAFGIYLGLGLFTVQRRVAPGWIWLSVLLIPLAGLVLQITSRRVIYIRAYQVFSYSLLGLVHGSLLWTILTSEQPHQFSLLAGLVNAIVLITLTIGSYQISQKRHQRLQMPYGPVGTLDRVTGLVDPAVSPPDIQKHQDRLEKWSDLLWRLAPLTAGLSMLFVRGLSDSGIELVVAMTAFAFAVAGVAGAGGLCSSLVATRRWEREHNKPIYVKRPRSR